MVDFAAGIRLSSPQGSQELILVLKTQIAEYRSNPVLHLGFILSLGIATSTLLCILVLNHASKQQYQQANVQLKSQEAFHIVARPGSQVSKHDFALLRKQGFVQIAPVLTFRKKLSNGKYLTFRAIDMLAMSISMPERFNAQSVLLTQAYLDSLSITGKDNVLQLADTTMIPFQLTTKALWTDVALLDIALAWQLFPYEGDYSYLVVSPLTAKARKQLESALPQHLSLYEPWSLEERQGFADALHLNLTAMAILGFIVSLFIAYQAGNQAWQRRGELTGLLRQLGVQLTTIKIALVLEALFLIITAGIIGILISVTLVTVLLPLLGLTLDQLYELNTSGHFVWQWQYALWALIISVIAVFTSLIKQLKQIGTEHIAISVRRVQKPFPRMGTLSITAVLTLLFIIWPSQDWYQIMVKYGLLLMASVALLPNFLQLLLSLLRHCINTFRFNYLLIDAGKQISRRYLPLAAFYLALTSSIAAALMVHSFEIAFVKYLNQRLSADIFIRYPQGQKQLVMHWLSTRPEVDEYIPYQHTWSKIGNESVKVSSYQSERQIDALLFKSQIQTEISESGCYINEQLALRRVLSVSQQLTISQGGKQFTCVIKGIYYDYGYPGLSVTMKKELADNTFTGWVDTGIGVFFKPGFSISRENIQTDLGLEDAQVYAPEKVKNRALEIFSQTFILTRSIATVLLAIACFGLFLSANSLELARKADLYIMRSLGYNQTELFSHMLTQWLLLAIGAILLCWPVATILAQTLVSKALPASFGWSMPLIVNLEPFAVSSVLALLFLIPALSIPLLRLNIKVGS